MIIRELFIKLGLAGASTVDNELGKVDGSINQTIASFNALGGVMAGVFGALTISSITQTADEMQSLQARLNNLPQTINNGAEAFDNVAAHANDTRMAIGSYASFLLRLGNATQDTVKTQEELLSLTDTVSKAMVVGGATAEEQSNSMLQFAQALGSGVLQGDEFRSMAEAAPQLLDAIGKALGYPRDQLKQIAADGKLTTTAVITALKKIGPQFDAQFKRMPLTIGQATTIMGNRWDAFINKLNRSSGAVTWVANKFLWLADKVEYSLDIITDALGGAENAVKLLAIVVGSAALVGAVYALGAAVQFLFSPVTLVIGALALLFLVLEDIYGWTQGKKSIMGDIFGNFSDYADDIDKLKTAIDWLLMPLESLAYWLNVLTGMSEPPPWLSSLLGIDTSMSGNNAGPQQINGGNRVAGAPVIGPNGIPTGEVYGADANAPATPPKGTVTERPSWWPDWLGGPGKPLFQQAPLIPQAPIASLAAPAQSKTTVITATSSPTVSVTVQAQPGQSTDSLGDMLADKVRNIFGDLNAATAREIQNNAGAR